MRKMTFNEIAQHLTAEALHTFENTDPIYIWTDDDFHLLITDKQVIRKGIAYPADPVSDAYTIEDISEYFEMLASEDAE